MKRYFFLIMLLPLLLAGCGTASDNFFGPSSGGNGGGGQGDTNIQLLGTKWHYDNAWIFINDDYSGGGYLHEKIDVYFHSSTEAFVEWYAKADGSKPVYYHAHYLYTIDSGYIVMSPMNYYMSDQYRIEGNAFKIESSDIISDIAGNEFEKSIITADDRKMISNYIGNVGSMRWYYDDEYKLIICGSGDMPDFDSPEKQPWHDFYVDALEIEEGITSIGNYNFTQHNLTEVDLPSTITRIGTYAFAASWIKEINLPDALQSIEEGAFCKCESLDVIIPSNVESIGTCAFENCKEVWFDENHNIKILKRDNIGASKVTGIYNLLALETIEDGANIKCGGSKYESVQLRLPNSVKHIGAAAFDGYINRVYIGENFSTFNGIPFYSLVNGRMYISQKTPPTATESGLKIVSNVDKWTLYVPKGCKSAYASAPYWKEFANIYEDDSL